MTSPARAAPVQPALSSGPIGDRIGVLAGGGRLPLTIADSVVERGGSVHIVGIEGEADPGIAFFPHTWVNWGEVGRMVATLRSEGGSELVIVGTVRRPDLWKLRPDAGFFLSLPQILEMLAGGDDSVLSRVVRFFEAKGFKVRGAHEVAPDLLVDGGQLGAVSLDRRGRFDAELGFAVRAALAALDAGQAVAVADGRVLAIEGAEGTDAMLARVARTRRGGGRDGTTGGVLAKGPKPGQELRVDMPAIGPRTVALAAEAGLAGIAVEAGAVLLLDRTEAVRGADARGIAIEALPRAAAEPAGHAAAARGPACVVGRLRPRPGDKADIEKGLAVVERLSAFETGHAAVVARAYILAIAAGETAAAVLERTAALRQWGMGTRRRRGVLAWRIGSQEADPGRFEPLFGQAAAQGLAGLVVTGPPAALAVFDGAARLADRHDLFLVACGERP
jgi:lipid-A-disaccharide synthase